MNIELDVLGEVSAREHGFLEPITQGADAIGSLGILGALITIAVTYIRDKNNAARNLRSALSAEIIEAVAEKLTSRSNPSEENGGSMVDAARLFVPLTKLNFEMSRPRDLEIRQYVEIVIQKVNYGQPVPRMDEIISDLTQKLSTWSRSPRKIRRELSRLTHAPSED
ncbi:hypothetical protein ACNPM8_14450 [Glutamicibacter sp. AGC46]